MLTFVIPWRDCGDPQRQANAKHVVDYYTNLDMGPVIVTDDGNQAGEPFNRSAAYNRGLAQATTNIIMWVEADTLIPVPQIADAWVLANNTPGLVVPFTRRHELNPEQTRAVFNGANPFTMTGGKRVLPDKQSIGQAGLTSRDTMTAIGGKWDEHFAGWGYDDNAMFHVFKALAGPPRWVEGKGIHLWHKPANTDHRQATAANRKRWAALRKMTPAQLREHLA